MEIAVALGLAAKDVEAVAYELDAADTRAEAKCIVLAGALVENGKRSRMPTLWRNAITTGSSTRATGWPRTAYDGFVKK
jgi:hypothetical protein